MRDLLRVIRNKKHHYQELNPDLKAVLGAVPDGYASYFRCVSVSLCATWLCLRVH